ncbi:hypothetical protein RF657_19360 [Yersinia rochesterensis]|uniref:hypothetical protein n=1 Tax=Yersinia rochesterensis TaxID=1604335 RepID=UPI0028532B55|nr:hypothetical protein [Yersinia rochesterensis]MDR5020524.1 hypothetical protein [Yersinia rochesterensis]
MLSKEYDIDGRIPWELEPYYSRHVIAMTREELHGKSDIACELAFRDKQIADTEAELLSLREQLAELKALEPVAWRNRFTGYLHSNKPGIVDDCYDELFTAAKP